jgi:hypothetical protein
METHTTREQVEQEKVQEEETRVQPRFARADEPGEETLRARWARQHEEFGGVSWGSAFFGWLVSVGIAAILVGLLSAAGAAFGFSDVSDAEAEANAETIGIVGALLLLVVFGVAYYFGGYVSGRLSRFDGARQGLGHRPRRNDPAGCRGAGVRRGIQHLRAAQPAAYPDRRG